MAAKVGDIGRAACALYPSGRVIIDGAPMAARAEKGPIEAGTEIVVVGSDRFCLIVRAFDSANTTISLPNHGQVILSAKEAAERQAIELEAARKVAEYAHGQLFRKMMVINAVAGLVIGMGLVVIQSARAGYNADLLWVPPLLAASWVSIVAIVFSLGLATENLVVFLSIPGALLGLIIGMLVWGPFVAVALSGIFGIVVLAATLAVEALRHPIA
jgi:hypothetical protein